MAQSQTTLTIPTLAPDLEKSPNLTPDLENSPNLAPDLENSPNLAPDLDVEIVDYSHRAQWLRAAVLGANDGLLSTAALMVGVSAVRSDSATVLLAGAAGTAAGACSMAIGEFVSVYSQYDIEMYQLKRENGHEREVSDEKRKGLPSPLKAAAASAAAFIAGAVVPLLAAAFVGNYRVRMGVVVGAVSLALLGFGGLGAYLGRAPLVRSSLRVLFGGWFAMGITFGLTKLVGSLGI